MRQKHLPILLFPWLCCVFWINEHGPHFPPPLTTESPTTHTLLQVQVPQIIVFRGGAFFAWPTLFRSPGSVWRPLFRRRGAAPRQNFACAAGKWGHLAQLCVSVRFAIVVEQELNPFVAILLTLLFFIVRYSSHTFSIYICFCESGSAPSAFALALSLEHSHR